MRPERARSTPPSSRPGEPPSATVEPPSEPMQMCAYDLTPPSAKKRRHFWALRPAPTPRRTQEGGCPCALEPGPGALQTSARHCPNGRLIRGKVWNGELHPRIRNRPSFTAQVLPERRSVPRGPVASGRKSPVVPTAQGHEKLRLAWRLLADHRLGSNVVQLQLLYRHLPGRPSETVPALTGVAVQDGSDAAEVVAFEHSAANAHGDAAHDALSGRSSTPRPRTSNSISAKAWNTTEDR